MDFAIDFRSRFLPPITKKTSEILVKIASGGSPGPLEWLREASGTALGTLSSSARDFEPQKCRPSSSFLPLLGSKWRPAGALKSPENRFFAKKGAPRRACLLIFAARAVFLDFPLDCGSILSEKSMFFRTRFPHAARAFFEMATLTIVWFLQYESHFFIFCLRAFFRKRWQKNGPKPRSEKSLKKPPSGDLFWHPKSIKIDVGAAGNRKNRAKNRKNGMQKFMRFLACEKNTKKREKKGRDGTPRRNARCPGR